MIAPTGNLFAATPERLDEERVDELACIRGVRVERIVSTGQASPPGFWYDQDWSEWVLVLSGSAGLRFESEAEPRRLGPGDYVTIPPHARHRVEWTDPARPTVRLAVYVRSEPEAG